MRQIKEFDPHPFEYHQVIELTIETLTNMGVGLGRVNGWVVMVPFTIPGEVVSASVFKNHPNYSEADLVEVITPSPHRVEPKCPLFSSCGGCQYQHLSYTHQLIWKQKQIAELLERLAGITFPVNPTIGSPKSYNYRSKITPHFQKPKDTSKPLPIGFLKQGTRHTIIDVPHCPIATEAINKLLPAERQKVISGERKFKKGGTLLLRHSLEGVTTNHKKIISEKVGNLTFQFLAGDFFQNNPFILESFVNYAIKQAKSEGINYFIDAYCGVGVFALCAAHAFKEVAGVEVTATSIDWAKSNAKLNEISNASFMVGTAEHIFQNINFPASESAILIDPPRKGCDAIFIEQLLTWAPKRIVYVSCDPATQARDLKPLLAGNYQIVDVQPVDLFPQTRHVENIITLSFN